MSTVFCEMMNCVHNDSGVCGADSIAVIDGKCVKIEKKSVDEKTNKAGSGRRIKVFEGSDWV